MQTQLQFRHSGKTIQTHITVIISKFCLIVRCSSLHFVIDAWKQKNDVFEISL